MSRALPSAVHSERQIIGSALVAPQTIDVAAEIIGADDFYAESHATIWRAIVSLWSEGQAVDQITVRTHLHTAGRLSSVGGDDYLLGLTDVFPHVEHVETHARIVRDKARLRNLAHACQEVLARTYANPDDVAVFLDEAETLLFSATQDRHAEAGLEHVSVVARRCLENIQAVAANKGEVAGIKSGLRDLDGVLGGFKPGKLYIVAGRPGMGKSALAMCFANACATAKNPVAFFSLEMPAEELVNRQIASSTGIDLSQLETARFDAGQWSKIDRCAMQMRDQPFMIDQTPQLSLNQLRARVRRFKSRYGTADGLGMIVVDYLQLMTPGVKCHSREEQVATVSRGLKALSKEIGWPVVALAQLNREVDKRADRRPELSDLRESGQIEQDADVIAFVFREEMVKRTPENVGMAEIIIRKHRGGRTGAVKVAYVAHQTKFVDLAQPTTPDDFRDDYETAGGWQ